VSSRFVARGLVVETADQGETSLRARVFAEDEGLVTIFRLTLLSPVRRIHSLNKARFSPIYRLNLILILFILLSINGCYSKNAKNINFNLNEMYLHFEIEDSNGKSFLQNASNKEEKILFVNENKEKFYTKSSFKFNIENDAYFLDKGSIFKFNSISKKITQIAKTRNEYILAIKHKNNYVYYISNVDNNFFLKLKNINKHEFNLENPKIFDITRHVKLTNEVCSIDLNISPDNSKIAFIFKDGSDIKAGYVDINNDTIKILPVKNFKTYAYNKINIDFIDDNLIIYSFDAEKVAIFSIKDKSIIKYIDGFSIFLLNYKDLILFYKYYDKGKPEEYLDFCVAKFNKEDFEFSVIFEARKKMHKEVPLVPILLDKNLIILTRETYGFLITRERFGFLIEDRDKYNIYIINLNEENMNEIKPILMEKYIHHFRDNLKNIIVSKNI
jgi:hypothetical protein